MGTRIDIEDVQFSKIADYYMDPIGLAKILIEELVDYRKEREEMVASGLPIEHIWYFDGIIVRTETILSRLGVENIPVAGDN
jgi:hypothetical protein